MSSETMSSDIESNRIAANSASQKKRQLMSTASLNTYRNQPDEAGRFGIHGGRFVAETLMPPILNV